MEADSPASEDVGIDSKPIVHNAALSPLVRLRYHADQVSRIRALLEQQGTFHFPALDNGLFPAAPGNVATASGYRYVWVRDNTFVAHAHLVNGRLTEAVRNSDALAAYFTTHIRRFHDIIEGRRDPGDPMARPHVRFDGAQLRELPERWAHAQNDALGYFLWFRSRLAREGLIELTADELNLLGTLVRFFRAIRFWQDEDSGHWEETRKISVSSIGVVVGGLQELHAALGSRGSVSSGRASSPAPVEPDEVEALAAEGRRALYEILPHECVQADPRKRRRYDAALLFLIHPIGVLEGEVANRVLTDVRENLQGDYGIRRYRGDSYWGADYKRHMAPEDRARNFSEDMESRDLLAQEGGEAQWCIFDPIVSSIYGERFRISRDQRDLDRQVEHLNRSLGQITGDESRFGGFKCPEAYYIEDGRYVPNDHTPLLWTQANLWAALMHLKRNLG